MKVLVQNYATSSITEPLYISEAINSIRGCEATVWSDQNVSSYDMFDITKPDIFITHYRLLTEDTIKYLTNHKNVRFLLNITSAQQDHVDIASRIVADNKIDCPFFFTNQPALLNKLVEKTTKIMSVMHGADVFLSKQKTEVPDYELDLGLLSNYSIGNRFDDFLENFNTYHLITQNEELSKEVDVSLSEFRMHAVYNKYKTLVITQDSMSLPQSFFDAVLYGNKVLLHSKYESQTDKMNSAIQSLLKVNDSLSIATDKIIDSKIDTDRIKSQVLSGHTCLHRVRRLFSKLKCSELDTALSQMIKRFHA